MTKVYTSVHTPKGAIEAIKSLGAEPILLPSFGGCDEITGAHADMQLCSIGGVIYRSTTPLPNTYPGCAAYNALVLGKYFVHRLDITAPCLIKAAKECGLELINIKQGYAKCACVIVDEHSIITADRGISRALEGKAEVLLIDSGHVKLEGYEYGFLGGASGLINGTLLFCGDLSRHPDFERIMSFANARGVKVQYIDEFELTDIGSFIEEKQMTTDTCN